MKSGMGRTSFMNSLVFSFLGSYLLEGVYSAHERHVQILARVSDQRMRPLPHFPQLRQNALSRSTSRAVRLWSSAVRHSGSLRTVEPLPQFAFAESPLPADLDRRDFLALRPKANRASRYAQPFRDCRG